MDIATIKNKFQNLVFAKSSFVSTFIVYITVTFVALTAYIELRKNIITELTIILLLVLEIQIILNFILSYIGIFNSVKNEKWINLIAQITLFVVNLMLIYQTLTSLISQTSSITLYAVVMVLCSITLFLQNYIDDRQSKKPLLILFILSVVFLVVINSINFVFGNPIFGTNQFFISQKQVNDIVYFLSFILLFTYLMTFFNIIRLNISKIKSIDQTKNLTQTN
jgi:hypothetical protein